MSTMPADEKQSQGSGLDLRVSALEADLAYFSARLALLGEPVTTHEWAQFKAYQSLEQSLKKILDQLRQSEKKRGADPDAD
jgi:hypothetical protein